MKNKLKSMFTRNIGMKLVSVVVAFVVWLTIINLADPRITRTISGIPIEMRNEKTVLSENETYVSSSDKTVRIKIQGVRSEIDKLTAADFTAYVDLKEMSKVYAMPVHVSLKSGISVSNLEITSQSISTMKGDIEEREGKPLMIKVVPKGVPENYYARLNDQSSKQVPLTGAKDAINSINMILAEPDLSGAIPSSGEIEAPLRAVDSNGNTVEIELPLKSIMVNMTLLPEELIKINLVTENEDTHESTVTAINGFGIKEKVGYSQEVRLAADAALLAELKETGVNIPYKAIGLMETKEDTIPLQQKLDEMYGGNVFVATDYTFVIVTKVEKYTTKAFTVKTDDIVCRNPNVNFDYRFVEDTITFEIYDFADSITEIQENDLGLYIDLTNYSKQGRSRVELRSSSSYKCIDESLQGGRSKLNDDGTKNKFLVDVLVDPKKPDGGDPTHPDDHDAGGDNETGE